MGFSLLQLEALDNAIAEGVLEVKYADKSVTYRSLDDMLKLRDLMKRELGLTNTAQSTRFMGVFDKGL